MCDGEITLYLTRDTKNELMEDNMSINVWVDALSKRLVAVYSCYKIAAHICDTPTSGRQLLCSGGTCSIQGKKCDLITLRLSV